MVADKYWIDPEGNIAEVGERHIISIIRHPEEFGLTKAYITKVHKKHRERPGQEGNAREEVLTKLMDMGWIRMRYIDREDYWGIQVSEKSSLPYRGRLKEWAKFILKYGRSGAGYSGVKVINLVPAQVEPDTTVEEVAAGSLEQKRKRGTFADFLNPSWGTVRRPRRKRRVK